MKAERGVPTSNEKKIVGLSFKDIKSQMALHICV